MIVILEKGDDVIWDLDKILAMDPDMTIIDTTVKPVDVELLAAVDLLKEAAGC